MKLYSGGVLASRQVGMAQQVTSRIVLVLADNRDEAYGKTLRMGREALPIDDGWIGHSVECSPVDEVAFHAWAIAYGYTKSD